MKVKQVSFSLDLSPINFFSSILMHFYQPNTHVTTSATNSDFLFIYFFFYIGWCSGGPGGSVKLWLFCLGLILGFIVFGGVVVVV